MNKKVRIDIDTVLGPTLVMIVIPEWNPNFLIALDSYLVPENIWSVMQNSQSVYAVADISAGLPHELHFSHWSLT